VKDYQDWEYCSVHMSVQMSAQGEEQTDFEKVANDALQSSVIEQQDIELDSNDEIASFGKDTLQDRLKDAVEVTSFDGDFSIEDELEDEQDQFQDEIAAVNQSINVSTTGNSSSDDSSVDIDVFFPSLLLSFETLLNSMFKDLLNGVKHHDLYSMGLAQYLKLEDEQVDGNAVKLRYRLPIDNIKYVMEAINP